MGRTTLADKVAALLHAFVLEVSLSTLHDFLSTFVSFTTDMGTELGLADFEARQQNNDNNKNEQQSDKQQHKQSLSRPPIFTLRFQPSSKPAQ